LGGGPTSPAGFDEDGRADHANGIRIPARARVPDRRSFACTAGDFVQMERPELAAGAIRVFFDRIGFG
jgi:hypothetical protein